MASEKLQNIFNKKSPWVGIPAAIMTDLLLVQPRGLRDGLYEAPLFNTGCQVLYVLGGLLTAGAVVHGSGMDSNKAFWLAASLVQAGSWFGNLLCAHEPIRFFDTTLNCIDHHEKRRAGLLLK